MLQKRLNTKPSLFRKGLNAVIAVEICGFFGSYFLWTRMNRDQEFRGFINDKFPFALEAFYQIGELFDKKALAHLREVDSAVFAAKKSQ